LFSNIHCASKTSCNVARPSSSLVIPWETQQTNKIELTEIKMSDYLI